MKSSVTVKGQSWQEKVKDIRNEMRKKDVSVLVVTALDEVACKCLSGAW